jgi:threonine dehydrogenase-like Zn-dependent dehydrogenase
VQPLLHCTRLVCSESHPHGNALESKGDLPHEDCTFLGSWRHPIDDIPEPKTRPGTVNVEVEWCGICGTELHEYLDGPIFAPTAGASHPLIGETVPTTLGHEFAGIVHEVGDSVDDVHVGDRVVVEPYIICGHCDPCTKGRYNVCRSLGFVGLSGFGGGFSQFVLVEPAEVRKHIAPVAGADQVIDPRTSDVVREVLELTKGRGADVSFECAMMNNKEENVKILVHP